jgi:alpha-L-rhamnosidase
MGVPFWGLGSAGDMFQNMKKGKWTATAYFANSARLLSIIAGILGYKDDKKTYLKLFEKIKRAFNAILVDKAGNITNGFQSIYALAVYFGLVDGKAKQRNIENLNNDVAKNGDHLTTGFVGTPYLTFALSDHGHIDTAYRLLLQETCPSWLYPIKCGATSIWELWDALMPDGHVHEKGNMVSFNHYAYGAIGDWMYRRIAGIEAVEAGYKRIRIAPMPDGGLTRVECTHKSPYGTIASRWRYEGNAFVLDVEIPCNTSAEIVLPDGQTANIGSGEHHFTTAKGAY